MLCLFTEIETRAFKVAIHTSFCHPLHTIFRFRSNDLTQMHEPFNSFHKNNPKNPHANSICRSVSPLARHAPLSPSPHAKGNGRLAAPVMPLPSKQRSAYHGSELSGRTVRQTSPTGLNRTEEKHRNHSAKNHRVDDKVIVSVSTRSRLKLKENLSSIGCPCVAPHKATTCFKGPSIRIAKSYN